MSLLDEFYANFGASSQGSVKDFSQIGLQPLA